ncbi:MAG: hypothetical protein U0840_16490 [Gemmataceae bacterium]
MKRRATSRERQLLEQQNPPIMDPLAQEYAVWRRRMLIWVALLTVGPLLLQALSGNFRIDLQWEEERELIPLGVLAVFATVLIYVTAVGAAGLGMIVAAAWCWANVPRSRRLARRAWFISLFGVMPTFFVPWTWLFGLHGVDAIQTALTGVWTVLTIVVPALLGIVPGVARAALAVKYFVPESPVPGWLSLAAAPFNAMVYLTLLAITLQLVVDPWLVCGLALLAASPLLGLAQAKRLVVRCGVAEVRQRLSGLLRAQRALTGIGIVLIGVFIHTRPVLRELSSLIDLPWLCNMVLGVMASRTLVTVVLSDVILAGLYHAWLAQQESEGTVFLKVLDSRMRVLGGLLGQKSSTATEVKAAQE